MYLQIFLFNYGSQYTTGGRVALFIFTFPLIISLIGPLIIKEEHYKKKSIIGSFIAFIGIIIALRLNIIASGSTFKGDIIELISSLVLALQIVLNKRFIYNINKWKVLFYRFVTGVALFLISALLFEEFIIENVKTDAWLSLSFQIVVVSIFCFTSFQYIISKHNSSSVSVFFFASPLFGITIGIILLNEPFDIRLLAGGVLVALGMYVVNMKKRGT